MQTNSLKMARTQLLAQKCQQIRTTMPPNIQLAFSNRRAIFSKLIKWDCKTNYTFCPFNFNLQKNSYELSWRIQIKWIGPKIQDEISDTGVRNSKHHHQDDCGQKTQIEPFAYLFNFRIQFFVCDLFIVSYCAVKRINAIEEKKKPNLHRQRPTHSFQWIVHMFW